MYIGHYYILLNWPYVIRPYSVKALNEVTLTPLQSSGVWLYTNAAETTGCKNNHYNRQSVKQLPEIHLNISPLPPITVSQYFRTLLHP